MNLSTFDLSIDMENHFSLSVSLISYIASLVAHSTGYSQVTQPVQTEEEGTTQESEYWEAWFFGRLPLETSYYS